MSVTALFCNSKLRVNINSDCKHCKVSYLFKDREEARQKYTARVDLSNRFGQTKL